MINKLYAQQVPDASQLQLADKIVLALVVLAPLLMLSLRGWLNALLAAAFLFSVWHYAKKWRQSRNTLGSLDFWDKQLFICLAAPFLAIFFSQLLRGHWQDNPFDGPVRILASFVIFLYLRQIKFTVVKALGLVLPLSLWIVLALVLLNPELTAHWGGRYATYFVDPLTLGQYVLLLAFMCLALVHYHERPSLSLTLYQLSGFVIGVFLSFGSGSRSAWVALPALVLIYLVFLRTKRKVSWRWLAGAAVILPVVFLGHADLFLVRVSAAWSEWMQYFQQGHQDTSAGLRLSFIRAAWYLWLQSPWVGYGDGMAPNVMQIPALAPIATPTLEFGIKHNGVHNELMQNLLRSGVFGLLAYLAQLLIPLVLFYKSARSTHAAVSSPGVLGLMYISSIFFFGLSTETFNLKFTSSIYGLMVAILAAQCLSADPTPGPENNHVT
jgi:O-antigen ligase